MTSSPFWRADSVIRTTGGWSLHEQTWRAGGISTDAQKVKPGDLFVALKESFYDGHDDVAAAFVAGASAAIVSRQPMHVPADAPVVMVDDTQSALKALAQAARSRARGKIIAVTGLSGRASVKEMLRLTLSAVGKTYAAPESKKAGRDVFLALANLPLNADYGVFEVDGGRGFAPLSELLRPDIVVLPEEDTDFAEKEQNTARLPAGINKIAVVIVNRDVWGRKITALAKNRRLKKVLSFSEKTKADAYLIDCVLAGEEYIVKAMVAGKEVNYMMSLSSSKELPYSLAALLASFEASGNTAECAAALLGYLPFKRADLGVRTDGPVSGLSCQLKEGTH